MNRTIDYRRTAQEVSVRRIALVLSAVMCLGVTSSGNASAGILVPLVVENSGFESPTLFDDGFTSATQGWIAIGAAGNFNPTDTAYAGTTGDIGGDSLPAPATGHQIGFTGSNLSSGSLSQHVGQLLPETIYMLDAAVGRRLDNTFSAEAQMILRADDPTTGPTLGLLDIVSTGTIPSAGTFVSGNQLVVDSSLFPAQEGADLFIILRSAIGGQTSWDFVRLETMSAIPEPSSVALCATCLLAFVLVRARHRD